MRETTDLVNKSQCIPHSELSKPPLMARKYYQKIRDI